ncbi:MAG: peptidoglycan-binding protein [Clostridia bacterium]|nr:peptidoglycan-binding protein [Clostridia bacterium]
MKCPHCHNEIPDGSNICPLCFSSLTGANRGSSGSSASTGSRSTPENVQAATVKPRSQKKRRKKKNMAPMIIAIGLILILAVIMVLIVRSMFTGGVFLGGPSTSNTTPVPQATMETSNLIFYGQEPTATPLVMTPVPDIAVTPTPEPTAEPVARTYTTLKKGDTGADVVLLQQALAQLGLLTSAADGIYGTGTMTAVRNFQTQNGLDVDGIAGSKTQELLFSMSPVNEVTVDTTAAPGEILDLPG